MHTFRVVSDGVNATAANCYCLRHIQSGEFIRVWESVDPQNNWRITLHIEPNRSISDAVHAAIVERHEKLSNRVADMARTF